MFKRGLFIVLEGIDGAGTSTLTPLLKKYIENNYKKSVITTFEPWTSIYGIKIRKRLKNESSPESHGLEFLRLFVEDSFIHNKELIKPTLEKGMIVLSDRYRVSSFAYQNAQGIPLENIIKLHEQVELKIPDLTFYMNVNVEEALKRKKGGKDKFERKAFLEKVAENYIKLRDINLKYFGRVITINANLKLGQVASQVFSSFDEFYKKLADN